MIPNNEGLSHYIDTQVESFAWKRATVIETAVEQALQGGICGVLIFRDDNGDEIVGPHPMVPYGMIHEYRGRPDWVDDSEQ